MNTAKINTEPDKKEEILKKAVDRIMKKNPKKIYNPLGLSEKYLLSTL